MLKSVHRVSVTAGNIQFNVRKLVSVTQGGGNIKNCGFRISDFGFENRYPNRQAAIDNRQFAIRSAFELFKDLTAVSGCYFINEHTQRRNDV